MNELKKNRHQALFIELSHVQTFQYTCREIGEIMKDNQWLMDQ